ncbi:MFS transporter permease [Desulfosarcina sp. OttesenSCG-928-A07]|nr:MFS transporter permease [Desulfosarcina sp. OttesenSCG-928-G17]MDL2329790.1 MFS transporter permease [Desulfosarcina sp. OttesenSCG-928-A07]
MKETILPDSESLHEVVIPKENAVFWMDDQGRWCNAYGRFIHKRIIDHFNRSMGHDKDGYFVAQVRGDTREKVYFHYADTPLFAVRVTLETPVHLVLNTQRVIPLSPDLLFSRSDQLYQRMGDEIIRFGDRALMAISAYLEDTPEGLVIQIDGRKTRIPEMPA